MVVPDLQGLLLVDKPAGKTSHDIVEAIRSAWGVRKVGHTGTLDPFATGLMVLLLGKATKRAETFSGMDKEYEAVLRLGEETDTGDGEGAVVSTAGVPELSGERVRRTLEGFLGEREQVPPAYSAVKVAGRAAYKYAREGKPVALAPRKIRIDRLELERLMDREIVFRVHCSAGTYVRTLGQDIAKALGTVGHLSSLRRTRVGEFGLDGARSLDELLALPESERGTRVLPLRLEVGPVAAPVSVPAFAPAAGNPAEPLSQAASASAADPLASAFGPLAAALREQVAREVERRLAEERPRMMAEAAERMLRALERADLDRVVEEKVRRILREAFA